MGSGSFVDEQDKITVVVLEQNGSKRVNRSFTLRRAYMNVQQFAKLGNLARSLPLSQGEDERSCSIVFGDESCRRHCGSKHERTLTDTKSRLMRDYV
jgi:hypothetical protein